MGGRAEVSQPLRQQEPGPVQSPLHRFLGNTDHHGHLGMSHPLNADEVEDLPLVLGKALNYLQHASAVRAEAGGGADWRGSNAGFRQRRGSGPFLQAAGQVIELPAHVLVGQCKETAHGRGTGRP
jgi:hypothetical protein